jgi:hypothetical protein
MKNKIIVFLIVSFLGFTIAEASMTKTIPFYNNNYGIGTSTPATTLDVNGYIKALQTGTTTVCTSSIAGSIFYNQENSVFWGCNWNGTWTNFGAGTGGGGAGTVTSVDMSVPTGLTIGGNPITGAGTLALSLTGGYIIPTTANISTALENFSTTSANYWSGLGYGFSTTSTNAWSLLGLGFSTTSADQM